MPAVTQAPTTSPVTSSPSTAAEVTVTGYLTDTVCIGIINSADSTNITTDAPAHTVECMLLQYCIDSGFTVMEKVGDNYIARYQLDANGVNLAVAALQGLRDQGVVNNVQFTVTGVDTGVAATYTDAVTYNGQPLGVVIATTAVVAETPGAEITAGNPGVADLNSRSSGDDESRSSSKAVLYLALAFGLLGCAILAVGWDWRHSREHALSTTPFQPTHAAVPCQPAPHTAISLAQYVHAPPNPSAQTLQQLGGPGLLSWGSTHFNVPYDPAVLADAGPAKASNPASPHADISRAMTMFQSSTTAAPASDPGNDNDEERVIDVPHAANGGDSGVVEAPPTDQRVDRIKSAKAESQPVGLGLAPSEFWRLSAEMRQTAISSIQPRAEGPRADNDGDSGVVQAPPMDERVARIKIAKAESKRRLSAEIGQKAPPMDERVARIKIAKAESQRRASVRSVEMRQNVIQQEMIDRAERARAAKQASIRQKQNTVASSDSGGGGGGGSKGFQGLLQRSDSVNSGVYTAPSDSANSGVSTAPNVEVGCPFLHFFFGECCPNSARIHFHLSPWCLPSP